MPNQYTKLTRENIERKMNRKRHPVQNATELAKEFGYETSYYRDTPVALWGSTGNRPPVSFVKKVKALIGEEAYNQLRDDRFVNRAYR